MLGNHIRFVAAPPSEQATRVVLVFNCASSAAIGDLVYQDTTVETLVNVCEDNTTLEPAIGVIIDKREDTVCEVLVLGVYVGYTGLDIGDRIYLGTDGTVTTTKPSVGYMQTMGQAVAGNAIFFLPNSQRVLQT